MDLSLSASFSAMHINWMSSRVDLVVAGEKKTLELNESQFVEFEESSLKAIERCLNIMWLLLRALHSRHTTFFLVIRIIIFLLGERRLAINCIADGEFYYTNSLTLPPSSKRARQNVTRFSLFLLCQDFSNFSSHCTTGGCWACWQCREIHVFRIDSEKSTGLISLSSTHHVRFIVQTHYCHSAAMFFNIRLSGC